MASKQTSNQQPAVRSRGAHTTRQPAQTARSGTSRTKRAPQAGRRAAGGLYGVGTAKQPFAPVPSPKQVDYPLLEGEIQRWWDEHDVLEHYLLRNEDADRRWSFIDGPMTANNPMGVHHAWGRTYKDLWQRFNTMRGFRQRYQNGWDSQGLHVEVEVEKELGFTNKHDIEAYGIAHFVEACKDRVRRYAAIATQQSIRLGEWMDWNDSYYTMSDENNYTIWGFLKRCWQEGWIYKGLDVMPWCPRCATGISDMEINEGRWEVQHTSVYVRLPLVDRPGEYLLVWTTTPWTLPANVAVAVNADLTYAKVEQDGEFYYLSEEVVPKLAKLRGHEHGEARVVETLPGRAMLGWRYEGPFDDLPAWQQVGMEHRVVAWAEVGAEEGTGIVHLAPGCGREDYALSKEHELAVLAPVDENGVYVEGYAWLTGQHVAEVARPIFEDLRRKGLFYQTESYRHVYPHCWRCKTELIFRLVDEWFISMRELRPRLMAIVQGIRWIPGFGLERELDWLRNMEDWMISKKRYWGLALPIYECAACGHFEIIGDKEELQARAVAGWEEFEGHTPHRPWVDAVKIQCSQCGEKVGRVPDVGNPWLDAGIVPFSTLHYHDDRAYWRQWFPAQFITEGFPGQFRNWFYALLVMAVALENTAPFQTVLGYATLLDERGEEMHKSRGNSIPFDVAAAIVGSDTMRWLYTNHAPEQNLRFPRIPTDAEAEAARALGQPPRLSDLWLQARNALDKLWDVYRFFVTYANIDGFDPVTHQLPVAERSDADRWVLSELHTLIATVTEHLAIYDAQSAAAAVTEFVLNLSNWYVRRSRRQFWKGEEDAGKVAAYLTLYECLVTVTKLLAPFTPFLAEALYQNLVRRVDAQAPASVHLCDWPQANAALVDRRLHEETALVLRLVNLGRSAREKGQLRVRQPLATLHVRVMSEAERESLQRLQDQVLEELNVKRLAFLPAGSNMLSYALRPRPQVLGPKYGKQLPHVLAAVRALDAYAAAEALREHGAVTVDVAGQPVRLTPEEVEVVASARDGFVAAEDRGYVAVLETALTPELVAEGLVRDLTHYLQDVRKRAGLEIEDAIDIWLSTDAELASIVRAQTSYVSDETLARHLHVAVSGQEGADDMPPTSAYTETIPAAKLGGHAVEVAIAKVAR
ncbi:MAG TPA: isoleucine--tRNA ligase [Ktedonobacterales bacterium]